MLLFAGWNKLSVGGADWVFSDSLRNILVFQNFVVQSDGSTAGVLNPIIENPWLWKSIAGAVIVSELCFIAIMFVPRGWQRMALLAVGVGFILSLDVAMQLPNPVLLSLLLVFVDWNWVVERAMRHVHRLRSAPFLVELRQGRPAEGSRRLGE